MVTPVDSLRTTILFAYIYLPEQIIPLENEMKKPSDFPWIVNLSMSFVTLLYVCMGLFGYMMCTDSCEGSITLNLGAGV